MNIEILPDAPFALRINGWSVSLVEFDPDQCAHGGLNIIDPSRPDSWHPAWDILPAGHRVLLVSRGGEWKRGAVAGMILAPSLNAAAAWIERGSL